jgi:glycopeptide antibiotics resistance protein
MWSPDEIEAAARNYPGFLPGMVVSVVVGFVSSGRVARALGVGRILAYSLVFNAMLILSATLTPGGDAPRRGAMSCDFSRLGPAPLADILTISDVSLNVFLFVPLGAALGLLPRSRRKTGLLVAAIALPSAIETIQLLAVPLDRACQSADVADNLTGLFVGFIVGTLAGAAALRPRGRRAG